MKYIIIDNYHEEKEVTIESEYELLKWTMDMYLRCADLGEHFNKDEILKLFEYIPYSNLPSLIEDYEYTVKVVDN